MGKLVRRRMKRGEETAGAAEAFADLLEHAMARQLGDGETLTVGEAARRIAQRLRLLHDAMEAAAAAENRLEDLMRGHRRRRDQAVPRVYGYLTKIRRFVRGFLGLKAGDEFLGIHGSTPEDPDDLHALAGEIIGRTVDPAWPRPPASTGSITLKPRVVARELKDLRDELGGALNALVADGARLKVAKAARSRATAAFDDLHGNGARFVESGLVLVGLEDLAAQVRPGVGSRGRPPKEQTIAERRRRQLEPGVPELPAGAEATGLLLAEVSESAESPEIPGPPDDEDGEEEI